MLAAIALLLSALTAVATWSGPALAVDSVDPRPVPVLKWKVSRIFDEGEQLRSHVLGDGATEAADGVITFPRGSGTFDEATGRTDLRFQGWVEATAYTATGAKHFSVRIEDPWIQIDTSGNGHVRAVVTSVVYATEPGAEDTVNLPTRVVLTTFRAGTADWSLNDALYSLTATPAWAGVVPPDTQATRELGFAPGTPVEGKAFNLQFLQHLTYPPRALFIASRTAADPLKAPADFTVQAPDGRPGVVAKVTGSSYADGVEVSVDGFGFTSVTNHGQDDGIVVAIAEAGKYPNLTLAPTEIVAQVRVPPEDMLENDWSVELNAASTALANNKQYAVYTWQSPNRSNTTQDTETPLVIDFSTLNPRSAKSSTTTTNAVIKRQPTTQRFGTLRVKVRASGARPVGRVKVKMVGPGLRRVTSKQVRGRAVTLRMPKTTRGSYQVVATFEPAGELTGSRDLVRFRVRR